jgi:hypothetical protein
VATCTRELTTFSHVEVRVSDVGPASRNGINYLVIISLSETLITPIDRNVSLVSPPVTLLAIMVGITHHPYRADGALTFW